MASKSLGWACAAILIGSTVANAQVDLTRMLNSLSFASDDPPSVAAEAPAAETKAEAGLPPDDEADLPPQVPAPPEAIPSPRNLQPPRNLEAAPQVEGPIGGAGLDDYLDEPIPEREIPGDAPSLPRLPTPSPEPYTFPADDAAAYAAPHDSGMVGQRVDLDSMLAGTDEGANDCGPAVEGNAHFGWPAGSVPAHATSGGSVRGVKVYRPTPYLAQPNLPPPASFESNYRTPACFRDLWGGYAAQKAHHCQMWHKHLHGHCRCIHGQSCGGQPCGGCAPPPAPVAAPVVPPQACPPQDVDCARTPQAASRHW